MNQQITLKDMIAHRPLVIAWAWEMLCIAFAVYAMVGLGNDMLGLAGVFAGVMPFAVVMVLFIRSRKTTGNGPDRSKDLVQ